MTDAPAFRVAGRNVHGLHFRLQFGICVDEFDVIMNNGGTDALGAYLGGLSFATDVGIAVLRDDADYPFAVRFNLPALGSGKEMIEEVVAAFDVWISRKK